MACKTCLDSGWVCECHEDRPWGGVSDDATACDVGPGVPCPDCNETYGVQPRMPDGFVTTVDLDGDKFH